MNKRRALFWFCVTLVYTAGTFYLSSLKRFPKFIPTGFHFDWILHAIEYGILGVLVMMTTHALGWNSRAQSAWITVGFCGVVGGLNELFQKTIPNRSPSIGDEVANLIGVALFLAGYFLIRRSYKPTTGSTIAN